MADAAAGGKIRLVLDYLPCEACLEIPVEDQELHCSVCRRLNRVVTVKLARDVTVVVEAPPLPPPPAEVEVPPAPAVAVEVEAPPGLAAAAEDTAVEVVIHPTPDPEELIVEAMTAAEPEAEPDAPPAGFTVAPAEEEADVEFGMTPAPDPVAPTQAPAPEEEREAPSFTLDPDSLEEQVEEGHAIESEAEAWAESVAEEEVEFEPVLPEDRPEEIHLAPPPEPEPWPQEPLPPPAPEPEEILEVLGEEPVVPTPEATSFEVLEEEPVATDPPAEAEWEDEPWPEEAVPPPPAEAPVEPEEAAPAEALADDDALAEPVEAEAGELDDPLTRLPGLGPMYARRLLQSGLQRVADLRGRDAFDLARETRISEKLVRRWVGIAELSALGVPLEYAEVLDEAGYGTVDALRKAKPERVARDVEKALARRTEGPPLDPVHPDTVRSWQGS